MTILANIIGGAALAALFVVFYALGVSAGREATQQRPTAHWENGDDYYGDDIIWFCSACKNDIVLRGGTPEEYSYRYCPNCGAKMENDE